LTGRTTSVTVRTNIKFIAAVALATRQRSAEVGAVIMLGMLFGLIVLIFGLVLRFDPEARRTPNDGGDR
jgi:hypothetical protein